MLKERLELWWVSQLWESPVADLRYQYKDMVSLLTSNMDEKDKIKIFMGILISRAENANPVVKKTVKSLVDNLGLNKNLKPIQEWIDSCKIDWEC